MHLLGGLHFLLQHFLAMPIFALQRFDMAQDIFQGLTLGVVLRLFYPLREIFAQFEEKVAGPFQFVELAFKFGVTIGHTRSSRLGDWPVRFGPLQSCHCDAAEWNPPGVVARTIEHCARPSCACFKFKTRRQWCLSRHECPLWGDFARTIDAAEGEASLPAKAIGKDRKGTPSVLLYLIAIPLAFVSQWIALAIYVCVAMMWLIPRIVPQRAGATTSSR